MPLKALQSQHCTLHCISLLAMSTCYFGSLMILSAQRIGLAVTRLNPVTSTGAERRLLDLAADFCRPFSRAWVPILTLQEVKASQWDCQVSFFSPHSDKIRKILAIIESPEKGMRGIWQCEGVCGQDTCLLAYHMLSCRFVLFSLTKKSLSHTQNDSNNRIKHKLTLC